MKDILDLVVSQFSPLHSNDVPIYEPLPPPYFCYQVLQYEIIHFFNYNWKNIEKIFNENIPC